jgi:hypothetical protein
MSAATPQACFSQPLMHRWPGPPPCQAQTVGCCGRQAAAATWRRQAASRKCFPVLLLAASSCCLRALSPTVHIDVQSAFKRDREAPLPRCGSLLLLYPVC